MAPTNRLKQALNRGQQTIGCRFLPDSYAAESYGLL